MAKRNFSLMQNKWSFLYQFVCWNGEYLYIYFFCYNLSGGGAVLLILMRNFRHTIFTIKQELNLCAHAAQKIEQIWVCWVKNQPFVLYNLLIKNEIILQNPICVLSKITKRLLLLKPHRTVNKVNRTLPF